MAYRLTPFADTGLNEPLLEHLIAKHQRAVRQRLAPLWDYYRNPARTGPDGRRRSAQEGGLPPRLTGDAWPDSRREVVVENDIAWRIHAMIDFIFGKPVRLVSTARDEQTRRRIERALDAVWEASGGVALLQDMALLGHVYGHVDLLLRIDDALFRADDPASFAHLLNIEPVEPTRGIALTDPGDYRRILAYIIHFQRQLNAVDRHRSLGRLAGTLRPRADTRRTAAVTEIFSATHRQRYEGGRLIDESPNRLAQIPVVHIQNLSQPFRFEGLGEVEPLITLQDELNTRLSDRACRVTLQSFKMYLAKGLDGFDKVPVRPGQVWSTDNPDAAIDEFGGDAASPSEESHIREIREAMDKVSGVPPVASGVVRARIGNLSSANALRVTLMGVLAKTARKRITYGRGIREMSALILAALDTAGVLRTDPADRGIRLQWRDPLPDDIREQVLTARAKQDLGVPTEAILDHLGHAPVDPGIE